jgi:hypothetical protein
MYIITEGRMEIYFTHCRKVAGSRPNVVNEFFQIYLILPAALGHVVCSTSNKNEYQKQKSNVSAESSAACASSWQPYRHLWTDCPDSLSVCLSYPEHCGAKHGDILKRLKLKVK